MNGGLLVLIKTDNDANAITFRLASTVAKLKPKKLVGLEANEVKHVI